MAYDEEVYEKLVGNFELLRNIIRQNTDGETLKVDLSKIEEIINKKYQILSRKKRQRISMNCIQILSQNMRNLEILFCMTS